MVLISGKSDVSNVSHIILWLNNTNISRTFTECGKQVTEPYGILEQTYKLGSAADDEKCSWYLHAPENHVVNVISISFTLQDEIKPARSDDVKVSTISMYDGAKPNETNWLNTWDIFIFLTCVYNIIIWENLYVLILIFFFILEFVVLI